jgi:hypothetical protein
LCSEYSRRNNTLTAHKATTCLTLTDEGIIDTMEMPVKMEPTPDDAMPVGSHAYSQMPLHSQNAHGDSGGHSHSHGHGQSSPPAGHWNWSRQAVATGSTGSGSGSGVGSRSVATTPTPTTTTATATADNLHARGLPPQAAAAPNAGRNTGESKTPAWDCERPVKIM